jgi:D-alanine-D-alanine ligase
VKQTIYHPADLITKLDNYFQRWPGGMLLSAVPMEDQVLVEEFIDGQEFSCGCIQFDDGKTMALPPSEVIKMVKVLILMQNISPEQVASEFRWIHRLKKIRKYRQVIAQVFEQLGINVCVRIDGFLTEDGTILLHDPNTIPGMSPTSFIFKQMAEIG